MQNVGIFFFFFFFFFFEHSVKQVHFVGKVKPVNFVGKVILQNLQKAQIHINFKLLQYGKFYIDSTIFIPVRAQSLTKS